MVAYVATLEHARGSFEAEAPGIVLDGPLLSAEAVAMMGQHVASVLAQSNDLKLKTATMQVQRTAAAAKPLASSRPCRAAQELRSALPTRLKGPAPVLGHA